MCAIDEKPFPRAPLVGALAMVAVAVGLVGVYQAGGLQTFAPAEAPAAPVEAVREVRFLDRADGAVVVQTVSDGRETVVSPGEGGFVRVVLRGFASDRKSRGLGSDAPFRLTRAADDRITLTDTATGRSISLNGFGSDNRRAFASLLEEGA